MISVTERRLLGPSYGFDFLKIPSRVHFRSRDRRATSTQATLSIPRPRQKDAVENAGKPAIPKTNQLINFESRYVRQPLCLVTEGARLLIDSDGRWSLYQEDTEESHGRCVATGALTLPPLAAAGLAQVITRKHAGSATMVWQNDAGECVAELFLSPPPCHVGPQDRWCKGLTSGFALEYRVSSLHANRAEFTIDLSSSGHWFGGGHFIRQVWPVDHAALEVGPWYPFDNGPNGVNTLVGPHWMTSHGLLVSIDPDTPFLHIGLNAPVKERAKQRRWGVGIQNMNREHLPLSKNNTRVGTGDGLLRVQARSDYRCKVVRHPLNDWSPTASMTTSTDDDISAGITEAKAAVTGMLSVRVALSATHNAKDAALMALNTLSPPGKAPAQEIIKSPIWTTWARYKTRVDQNKVLKFANEIVQRGLPRSVMEIDDRWQSAYGDLEFDKKKFPDAAGMISRLHDLGFQVTCWVMPFVEESSAAYREGASKGYFIKAEVDGAPSGLGWGRPKPGFFAWWNSQPVVALDVTNPEAVDWFVDRLKRLQEITGLDGFKFDAGEPCFLPPRFTTYGPISTPSDYTRLYVTRVAGQFSGGVSEVRTGHLTQDVAIMTRMGDRFSTWDVGNGLQSIIPTLLTSGLLGYPFCLPDMVGGNAYFGNAPDRELLVRWAQANALMPAMQFSIAPWDLDYTTERLVASALDVRRKLEGVLLNLAQDAADVLAPICRPLWFLDPYDTETFTIHDQYALGNDVIVAPVVQKGAQQRDVYLTKGTWRSLDDRNEIFEGGQWLRNLAAPLERLPCFVRVGSVDVNLR